VAFLCRREKEGNPLEEALVGAPKPSKLH
jgi:hypothetical protein